MTEYTSDEDYYPIRDLKKIGIRYLKYLKTIKLYDRSQFVFDLLTVIPFRYMVSSPRVQ